MRGRKPVPTMLKIISGQPGHHPIPKEIIPVGELFTPPEWLNGEQKAEWVYAIENAPKGLLRRLDRNIFAQWCVISVELVEHEIAIRIEGKVIEQGGAQRITVDKDGKKTKTVRSPIKVNNPRVRQIRSAQAMLIKVTSELGFSPTSRSRITLAGGGAKETNRFANNAAARRA